MDEGEARARAEQLRIRIQEDLVTIAQDQMAVLNELTEAEQRRYELLRATPQWMDREARRLARAELESLGLYETAALIELPAID